MYLRTKYLKMHPRSQVSVNAKALIIVAAPTSMLKKNIKASLIITPAVLKSPQTLQTRKAT